MQKILVYWRDIPAQVIIKRGRSRGKAALRPVFVTVEKRLKGARDPAPETGESTE